MTNDVTANLQAIKERITRAGQSGIDLVVFPECALTGYGLEEPCARAIAERIPGPTVSELIECCNRQSVYSVVGMLEQSGDQLFNVAVTVGPEGVLSVYRKVHLPYMGVDRFVAYGSGVVPPTEIRGVNIATLICYDYRRPEPTASLALEAADVILLPTNWPQGSEAGASILCPARALENRVYFLACNRVGSEGNVEYIGGSAAYHPDGSQLALAGRHVCAIDVEIDVNASRKKTFEAFDGALIDIIGDRRPETYKSLVAPSKCRSSRQQKSGDALP